MNLAIVTHNLMRQSAFFLHCNFCMTFLIRKKCCLLLFLFLMQLPVCSRGSLGVILTSPPQQCVHRYEGPLFQIVTISLRCHNSFSGFKENNANRRRREANRSRRCLGHMLLTLKLTLRLCHFFTCHPHDCRSGRGPFAVRWPSVTLCPPQIT